MQNSRLTLVSRTGKAIHRLLSERLWLSFFVLFLVMALTKSRSFIPYGRFWAEEGADFFASICGAGVSAGMLFLFNNHLQLWTNAGVFFATYFPLVFAPAAANIYAILLQAVPLIVLAAQRKNLGLSNPSVLIIALAYFGMPQAAEVWANTINLHFHFLIIAGLVLAVPAGGRYWFPISLLLLLAAGLSGIPANFLAPLFLIAAFSEKSVLRYTQAAVICTTAILQIMLLYQSGYQGERGLVPPLDIIALSGFVQSFYSLYFGVWGGDFVAGFLRPLLEPSVGIRTLLGFFILAATIILLFLLYRLPLSASPANIDGWRRMKLMVAALVSLVASITLALDDGPYLIHPWVGGRYFFAPNIFFLVLLLAGSAQRSLFQKAAILSVVLFSIAGVPRSFEGESWNEVVAQVPYAATGGVMAVELPIWPDGWHVRIEPACLR